jgi:hypothetical protein
MASEWEHDLAMSDLRELADHLWLVEEIPIQRIQELCDENVIECYKFVSTWHKLMDEMHKVMDRTEERMEAIPSE